MYDDCSISLACVQDDYILPLQGDCRNAVENMYVKYSTIVAQSLNNISMIIEFDDTNGRFLNEMKYMQ